MTRQVVLAIIGLAVLSTAGPTLVALAHAALPLVIAVGALVLAVRLVWFYTNRW